MKNIAIVALLAATVAMGAIVGACGGGESTPAQSPSNSAASAPADSSSAAPAASSAAPK